jgi:Ca-activated chloride channel homolog
MFDNPTALWLLLLLIPLILAWKQRPRTTRAVGNAFLWRQVAARSATSFTARLRRSWLLAAQIAFLLATVAALARPVLPFGARTVAVIVDLSASMGARDGKGTRLDAASAAAIATIESLPRSTRVRLIAARSAPQQIGEYVAWDPALRRVIQAQTPTAGPADVAAAIEAAAVAPADIYVFSDGTPQTSVRWMGVGKPLANAAVTNVAARRLPLSPAQGQVLVEAWNYGAEPLNTDIEVAHNGSLVGRYPVRLPSRNGTTIVVDVPAVDGVISARLVANDALEVDNSRLAMFGSINPVRVLVIGGTFFIEKALEANRTLLVDRVREQVRYDVLVCESCSALPPEDGDVLLIAAAPQPRAEAAVMTLSLPNHPIAGSLDLSGIRAVPVVGSAPRHVSEVIARIAGEPAILAYEVDGRRVIELRLDVTDASLAVSTAFPILIANAIDWLARRGENARELVAGGPLQWVFRERPTRQPEVVGPGGRVVPSFTTGLGLTSSSMDAAGVYVVRGGAVEERFVVNPSTASESDLTAASTATPATIARATLTSRAEQPVVMPLLLLALGMVSMEWWLRCRAAGRA